MRRLRWGRDRAGRGGFEADRRELTQQAVQPWKHVLGVIQDISSDQSIIEHLQSGQHTTHLAQMPQKQ